MQFDANFLTPYLQLQTIVLLSFLIQNLFAFQCNSKEFIQFVFEDQIPLSVNKSYVQAACESVGFHLIVPEDSKDEDCINELILSNGRVAYVFLGLTRNQSGHWIRDVDQTEIKYTSWGKEIIHPNMPINSEEGNCVYISYYLGYKWFKWIGLWYRFQCTFPKLFRVSNVLCERESK